MPHANQGMVCPAVNPGEKVCFVILGIDVHSVCNKVKRRCYKARMSPSVNSELNTIALQLNERGTALEQCPHLLTIMDVVKDSASVLVGTRKGTTQAVRLGHVVL